ncbi:MAG: hypothetical protein ACREFI_12355 [Stellaceae bacterium]
MRLCFVTGATRAFFPTLTVLLQSFTERIGGARLHVCDYGLGDGQREFLRRRGLLLDRPPALPLAMHPLREKAALMAFLRHAGVDPGSFDAVIWLDADLTLTTCSLADFEALAGAMIAGDVDIAASPQGTFAELLGSLRRLNSKTAPIERLLAEHAVDSARAYYSSGIFVCRARGFLEDWLELTMSVEDHAVLDQNVFNVLIQRTGKRVLELDIDIWQAQGETLDRLRVERGGAGDGPSVFLDERVVKILHATSPTTRHLFVGIASFCVSDLVLDGAFKLLRPRPLMGLQLELLARFMTAHRAELLALGLCRPAGTPVQGYEFRTMPETRRMPSPNPAP